MLYDNYLRNHDYLRISVTDKCNLRCRYCIPPEGIELFNHDQVLRNEEFLKIADIFISLGIKKIRFTGGEPLIRKGFIDIISQIRDKHKDIELGLTTNGIIIHEYIDDLKALHVSNINISLDTVSRERYKDLTGKDCFQTVVNNIENVLAYDFFNIKINTVLTEETLTELDQIIQSYQDENITLRFIEKMPLTDAEGGLTFCSSDRLVKALESRGTLSRRKNTDTKVALMYQYTYKNKYSMNIGIIPPVTHKFCSQCNRLRISCNGKLKTCLYSSNEMDLMDPIRNGSSTEEIILMIKEAVALKQNSHSLDECKSDFGCSSIDVPTMSKIGG